MSALAAQCIVVVFQPRGRKRIFFTKNWRSKKTQDFSGARIEQGTQIIIRSWFSCSWGGKTSWITSLPGIYIFLSNVLSIETKEISCRSSWIKRQLLISKLQTTKHFYWKENKDRFIKKIHMNVPKSRQRDDTKDMFISGAKVIVVSKYPRLLVKYSIGVSFLPALVDLLPDSCWKIVYFRHPPKRLQARLINKGNACGNVGKCETFVTTLRCLCIPSIFYEIVAE